MVSMLPPSVCHQVKKVNFCEAKQWPFSFCPGNFYSYRARCGNPLAGVGECYKGPALSAGGKGWRAATFAHVKTGRNSYPNQEVNVKPTVQIDLVGKVAERPPAEDAKKYHEYFNSPTAKLFCERYAKQAGTNRKVDLIFSFQVEASRSCEAISHYREHDWQHPSFSTGEQVPTQKISLFCSDPKLFEGTVAGNTSGHFVCLKERVKPLWRCYFWKTVRIFSLTNIALC